MTFATSKPLTRKKPLGRGKGFSNSSFDSCKRADVEGESGFSSEFQKQYFETPEEGTRESRLQARAERAAAQARENMERGQQVGRAADFSTMVASFSKENRQESESYRRLVVAFPCCACGIVGRSQFAHANEGKGFALKTDDRTGFSLCADEPGRKGCHARFDQYELVDGGRDAHRALAQHWGRKLAKR